MPDTNQPLNPSNLPVQSVTTIPTVTQSSQVPSQLQTFEYAGVRRRFVASFLDGMIVGIPVGILLTIISFVIQDTKSMPALLLNLVILIAFLAYPVYFLSKSGSTPGKNIMKIKVVTIDGNIPSAGKAFKREVLGKAIIGLVFLDWLWPLWDKRKQTLHDKVAGTFVVKVL